MLQLLRRMPRKLPRKLPRVRLPPPLLFRNNLPPADGGAIPC
jgi:hypothetical protein